MFLCCSHFRRASHETASLLTLSTLNGTQIVNMRFNRPAVRPCFVLLRTRCYRLDCGRRTRRRKLPQGRSRETTCWPTWRNRPRSIPIKKTWCRSRGRREVGAFHVFCKAHLALTPLKLQPNVTKRRDLSSMWVLSSGWTQPAYVTHTRRVFEKL